jgi:hypothetical protein
MWTKALAQPGAECRRQLLGFSVRIQPPVPDEHVEPLDLLDQQHDRATGGRDLVPSVVLEACPPTAQLIELVSFEPAFAHRLTLLSTSGSH